MKAKKIRLGLLALFGILLLGVFSIPKLGVPLMQQFSSEKAHAAGSGLYEVGSGKPYATIQAALNHLWTDQGASAFTATQTIRVYNGSYAEDIITPNAGLTPTATYRLVIQAADGNTPILEGSGTRDRAFSIYMTAGNVTINGLTVRNYKNYGIRTDGVPNVIVSNNTFYNVLGDGIYVGAAPASASLIYGNTVHNTGGNGIVLSGQTGAKAYNNFIYSVSGHGFRLSTYNNSLIYNNIISNAGQMGIRLITCSGDGVYNNTIYSATTVLNRAGIYLVTTSPNNTVKNNIIWRAHTSDTDYAIYVENAASLAGLVSNNNVLYATGGAEIGYYAGTAYSTLADWRAATNQDLNSVSADPGLANPGGATAVDYQISSSSVGHNIGADLSNIFTTDYFGNTRVLPWDIGAYELPYVAGDDTPNNGGTTTTTPSSTSTTPDNTLKILPITGADL